MRRRLILSFFVASVSRLVSITTTQAMDDEDFIGAFIGCASDDSEGESEQDVAKVIVKPNDEVACDKDKKLQEHFKEAAAQKHPQKAPRKPSVEKPELFHIPKGCFD